MSDDQKNNDMNPDEPPPLPPRAAQKPVSGSAVAAARRSDDEPPPFPPSLPKNQRGAAVASDSNEQASRLQSSAGQAPTRQSIARKPLVIGGAILGGLAILMVLALTFSGRGLRFFRQPPYASLPSKVPEIIASACAQTVKKCAVKTFDDVPTYAKNETHEEIKRQLNALSARIPPPALDVDKSCQDMIADAAVSPPELDNFMGLLITFPVKFRAQMPMTKGETRLVLRSYDTEGVLLEESTFQLDMDTSGGEMVKGRCEIEEDTFRNVYRFTIAKGSESPRTSRRRSN